MITNTKAFAMTTPFIGSFFTLVAVLGLVGTWAKALPVPVPVSVTHLWVAFLTWFMD